MIDSCRLVYRADSMVNWCPGLGTVLANEEVTADGRSDRGNFPVFRKRLRQWMMRITAYSDRLLDDLDLLDWPEKVKTMQRNWIGRSTGATALFSATRTRGDIADEKSTSRCSPPGLTPCSAPPTWCWRPSTTWSTGWSPPPGRTGTDPRWTYGAATPREAVAAYRRSIAAKSDLERQESKAEDRRLLRQLRDQPGQRQTGADLHRRLRVGRIRHRGDHGRPRPRPARLGIRPRARPADRGSHCRRRYFGGCVHGRRCAGQLRLPGRNGRGGGQGSHHRPLGGRGPRPGAHRIQAARLAFRPAALLG